MSLYLKSSFSIINTKSKQFLPDASITRFDITFQDISFNYANSTPVFDKLNLHIKQSEKVGIVGASGAGKSTFISLLLKYFDLNIGKILIGNTDISKVSDDSIRKLIAVIPQDISLFHDTLLNNIKYGNFGASKEEIVEAARQANIHDFIESLLQKYDTFVGEGGLKLSGGQRQRIAIARAILKNAPILILDEATSSLDTETELKIQKSINSILEKSNITVIAIAHKLSTLKHMDKIVVLEKGKISEESTHSSLLSNLNSYYKKLWEMQ